MAGKKTGSKNNIANRGARARIKYYGGKPVKEVRLYNKREGSVIMAAQYETGDLVQSSDGAYVKYSDIQEFAPENSAK